MDLRFIPLAENPANARKYGLKPHDLEALESKVESLDSSDLDSFRKKLTGIEGKFTERYFRQVFGLLPEELRPEKRRKLKAYDGVNNIFNLGYEVLQWKVHRAIIRAKLKPYLGFLHSRAPRDIYPVGCE